MRAEALVRMGAEALVGMGAEALVAHGVERAGGSCGSALGWELW